MVGNCFGSGVVRLILKLDECIMELTNPTALP